MREPLFDMNGNLVLGVKLNWFDKLLIKMRRK